jgi:hypothetical protein
VASIGLAQPQESGKKSTPARPPRDDALREELLRRVKEDQDARSRVIKAGPADAQAARTMAEVDRKNTARLKEIVNKHGWPGKSLVGEDGAHAAWLLVQHADKDHDFQKRCLTLLEKAVKRGEAAAADHAYLSDRVLVAENKKQLYGTQFRTVDGKMEPYPIADEKGLERRRKEAGLSSMAEYRKMLEQVYKTQVKKKD